MSSQPADKHPPVAPIRSYVLRRSHFSPAQRGAHDRLMPVYGIPFSKSLLNLPAVFGRHAPTILEIGFGMGEATAEIAAAHPEQNFLGVEVHTPGVGALLKMVEARGLRNVRIIEHDVQEVLDRQIPDDCLTGIHVFFPDPWPKARHHKRRLIQQQFVNKVVSKLCRGGYLHLATDWPDYAEQMVTTVQSTPGLCIIPITAGHEASAVAVPGPAGPGRKPDSQGPALARPVTKFERRGLNLGHPITDVFAVKTGDQTGTATAKRTVTSHPAGGAAQRGDV